MREQSSAQHICATVAISTSQRNGTLTLVDPKPLVGVVSPKTLSGKWNEGLENAALANRRVGELSGLDL